jgi:predicted ATPase
MERLTVKNFGPIKDVEIKLSKLVIFIGETGTGKSTLAKLISIFRDKSFWKNLSTKNAESKFRERLFHCQIE